MPPRLTAKRRAALRTAASHPKGSFDARTVSADDIIALTDLGLADDIDDCGHAQGSADPQNIHRGHPHFLRITDAGRTVARS